MDVTRFREQLARLTGPARIPVLLQIGQTLGMNSWRKGPGSSAALADLTGAIDALSEAYRLVDRGDPARGSIGVLFGWLLSARFGVHGGADEDRENAIAILAEGLGYANLQPIHAAMARISLGQMHLSRAMEAMHPAGLRSGRLPAGHTGDVDEAVRRFREILDGPRMSAEITEVAQTLLTVARSLRPLLNGDLAGFDFGKLMEAMSVMQRLMANGGPFAKFGSVMPFDLAAVDPRDYPVADMRGATQETPTVPPRRTVRPAEPAPAETRAARRAARSRLASLAGAGPQPVWDQALRLLEGGPSAIAGDDLDAFVGAAVNAAGPGDDLEAGLDHLVSAVALALRERRDGIGWADEEDPYGPALGHLAAAADAIPPSHPAACAVVEGLGGMLDDGRPLSGAITAVADRFARYADAISPRPDVVTALRDVCRAVPLTVDVPAGHPWHEVLGTADRHARLLAPRGAGQDQPAPPEVAAALLQVGASALLYLHAGPAVGAQCLDPATDRLGVIDLPVTNPLDPEDPGWSAIADRWAGGHLIVAATGDLARVPLPAVRTRAGRRLAQDVAVSQVSSGAQLVALAGRPAAPVGKTPLFVVNPRGDRNADMPDVLTLRRLFYPRSACIGRGLEPVDAPGSSDDVRGRLADASMVHLACGLDGTRLRLAGSDVLDASGGGLVVLTEPGPAAALLDAGFSGVIGWQRRVPAPFAALAIFMTHLMLADRDLPPAAAVNAVHRWMIDPDRELPPFLPGAHRRTVDTTDLTRPALWAALACYGR
jgi:hypothetical protein